MKKFANIILVVFVGFHFMNPSVSISSLAAKVKFNLTVHDFGKVKMGGEAVKCTFNYTNTGDDLLFISRVKTSCGCTEPEYSKEPLMPGETAEFVVGFKPDVVGAFNKKITVFTNAVNNSVILTIKGEVLD